MNAIELNQMENKLTDLRENIVRRLILIDSDKKRMNQILPKDLDDQSIVLENDEVIDKLDELERGEYKKISEALFRIKNGTYGKCCSCGKEIGYKRILAIPYAAKCLTCLNEELEEKETGS